jgi:hypothetical protein
MITWFLTGALVCCLIVYAPQCCYEYRAPKAYLFAWAVFGGLLFASPASWSGVLPGLVLAELGLYLALRSPDFDQETLFQQALLVGWAFLIAGHGAPRLLLNALLAASTIISLLALAEFAGYGLGKRFWVDFGALHWGKLHGRRPASCLGNPDVLGSYCAAMLPLAFALLYPFNALLVLLGLILSQARASWLAAGLPGLPLIGAYLWVTRRAILNDPSVQERLKYYRLTWRLIRERPWLGHGPGAFKILAQRDWRQSPRLKHVHCEWLELWHDTGLIGLLLRLAIMGAAIVRLLQGGRLETAFAACLVILAVDGCFSLSLRTLGLQIVWWTCIGLAMAAPTTVVCHWYKPLLLAVPNVAILAFMADWHYKRGLGLLMAGRLAAAMPRLLTALKCMPQHCDARFALATACTLAGREDLATLHLEKLARFDPYYLLSRSSAVDAQPMPPA